MPPAPDSPPTTPAELTAALCAAGALQRGSVITAAVSDRIQTPVSHLWFIEVDYAPGSTPLPGRLLLKWTVDGSPAPERGEPELVFYRELAPALPSPPVVRCLATAPPASPQQWLILEDLRASHTNPPWPERPEDHLVREAVAVLARLHARWWEAPTLGSTVGALHTESSLRTMVSGITAHLPDFLADLGDTLAPEDRLVLEVVFSSTLRPWLRLVDTRALTVIHGDAHTWNFLFPRTATGVPYLIDWQLWHLDVGARDLAFMIALHWDRDVRRELEPRLLHHYHQEIVRAGVDNYSLDDLRLDYRRCAVRNLTFPIILWARGLPREAWRHRLDCALAACRDLECADLL